MMSQAYERGRQRAAGFLASGQPQRLLGSVRLLARQTGRPAEMLTQQVTAFDQQRLVAVPDLNRYPELRDHPDRILAEDRGMIEGGVSRELIALDRTLRFFMHTRLFEETGLAFDIDGNIEECRSVYFPHTAEGAIHAKNVDGPMPAGYAPMAPIPHGTPWPFPHALFVDGVGSGLHIDEAPPEIFPVNVTALVYEHCATVPAATELLTRYNYFWGHGNLLVHDQHGNSVAFEKTQCRVATRGPNANGVNFISGMGALDPGIHAHQTQMRQKYLDQVGADWDGPEGCFWRESAQTYLNLATAVDELPDQPTLDEITEVMQRHEPGGPLCYIGERSHPDQPDACWTVTMYLFLMDRQRCIRRQCREGQPAYLDQPEIIQYGA